MAVVVFLNMVTLMVVTDQETMEYEEVLPWLHLVFLIIYTIEFILKLIGLRHHYFTSGWNILDFVVLIFCIVGESHDVFHHSEWKCTKQPFVQVY